MFACLTGKLPTCKPGQASWGRSLPRLKYQHPTIPGLYLSFATGLYLTFVWGRLIIPSAAYSKSCCSTQLICKQVLQYLTMTVHKTCLICAQVWKSLFAANIGTKLHITIIFDKRHLWSNVMGSTIHSVLVNLKISWSESCDKTIITDNFYPYHIIVDFAA